ncbi:type 2 isopentenyl-diphosphate Delta-isomerase [Lactobacillus jensenii]|jgi:isopentenyl-diphosphate delta-isomerase, type 2|uniref:Isopentenyl-diphosphate delta-isomerase n=1 Tax=Lactobacillus jensenii TaxID=109790 RepID=A0A5N1IB80_LACJE|nr:type 2 isopentenyl-diphosphate Delta-isomerase [Lactobacillus jensenii]ERJ44594.1 isopentenyl pyrophosphate isomerase [Lactobacillus jensenii MD IIE-70(2)]APT14696.1 type 2 isopentenyl-diphosphate Delta-isomerase [Lactobacillus jensenii]EEQ24735.1 isopentenyl-diphosphate delta-isomerase, type 2 [Lactobacillus jensenii 269-3]EEX27456.1 isopentenyl-diphosphate delta-isomerase, type 2 [Lactobacillus jensenii SJ-7A-US]KAA9236495.1 type 2 isopentenyl-diphosphate Delta-isomerase [Lactobacillus je
MSNHSKRKEEHLALAKKYFAIKENDFDRIELVRPALPESCVSPATIACEILGKKVKAPFYINAMTGGSEKSKEINRAIGKASRIGQIPFATGSSSILAKEKDQLASFYAAREENPDGLFFANVNPNTPASIAKNIVKELNADALQIHINTVQELAMPEGDRDFVWLDKLKAIRDEVDIPVIIKEVGFGFDKSSIDLLQKNDFHLIDLGGAGGTNFAQIENGRSSHPLPYLDELGLSTVKSALIAQDSGIDFFASGGIRNALDILKCLVLGAKSVGIANLFLQVYENGGEDGLVETVLRFEDELAGLFALFGINKVNEATKVKYALTKGLWKEFIQIAVDD